MAVFCILFFAHYFLLVFFFEAGWSHTFNLLEGSTEVARITESYFIRNLVDTQICSGEQVNGTSDRESFLEEAF